MTRTSILALAVALLAVAPAAADHKKPPKFKPFNGVSPEQFYQSSVARWADQFVTELGTAKAELGKTRLGLQDRQAVAAHTDRAAGAAATLARLARKTADREQLYQMFTPVEREYAELNNLVARNAHLGPAYARAGYAYQQLAATLTEGDRNAERAKGSVARLAGALDEQADDLWDAASTHLGPGFPRDLDRAIRTFARSARRLHRDLEDTGDVARAGAAFPAVGQAWGEVVTRLDRTPNLPAAVRTQAARIDGLYRRLGERVAVVAPPPVPNPAVPPQPPPPAITYTPPKAAVVAVAAGDGGGPRVQVFHDLRGRTPAFDFFAYDEQFRGGVRVAVADLDGDGVPDVVTAPGKGMPPLVRVFSGQDMGLLAEFLGADAQWTGGVNVAAADLTADGRALVAVAPAVGGAPHVRVFDLAQGKEATSFLAYPEAFRGGARLAWADVNADGNPDLVTAPGPGDHGPLVRAFNVADKRVLTEFLAFDPNWRGGLWLAAAQDVHIVCGLDAGGPAVVRVFKPTVHKNPAAEWVAFPEPYRGGVRVAYADIDGDGLRDFVCAPGGGLRDVPVRVFSGKNVQEIAGLPAFPGFEGGAFVAGR